VIRTCTHWYLVARRMVFFVREYGDPISRACHRGVTCLQKSWKYNDKVITRYGRTSNESGEEPLSLGQNYLPLNNPASG